jgi:hypothetical protein
VRATRTVCSARLEPPERIDPLVRPDGSDRESPLERIDVWRSAPADRSTRKEELDRWTVDPDRSDDEERLKVPSDLPELLDGALKDCEEPPLERDGALKERDEPLEGALKEREEPPDEREGPPKD